MEALLALALSIGPTDIARVDEFIDAPRAIFGRTRAEIEGRLGTPRTIEARSVARYTEPDVRDAVDDLGYPGVTLGVLRHSSALRRVTVTSDAFPLPRGLNVGAERARVESALGEPQELTVVRYLYLYADGFPDTVEFFFRDGRVHRIEWNYSAQ